jgi:RHS repeat-associated protein
LVSYTRGTDLSGSLEGAGGIGGLLARSSGYSSGNWSTHHFYHADGNGNITYLVDSSQAMAAAYRYDPFGNTLSSSGTMSAANVYRFSSKELHVNSGLYIYLYRFYDPSVQRWLNRDPIGELGGINLYVFVHNRPTNKKDPLGRDENLAPSSISFTITPCPPSNASSAPSSVQYPYSTFGDPSKESVMDAMMLAMLFVPVVGEEIDAALAAESTTLRFSQITASPWFSTEGDFAGQTISDVAGQLRAGTLSASDVPVQVVTMEDGSTLIVNTRSSLALSQAGVPQSSWNLIDMTGNENVVNSITSRLANNGLTSAGTSTLRITGSGSGASTYFGAGTVPRP